jgi:hypothetical protein
MESEADRRAATALKADGSLTGLDFEYTRSPPKETL